MTEEITQDTAPQSGISWKQGLLIAMGVPILIVPSIADLSIELWAMSILIWVLSVISGFFLNLNLGEMCATFRTSGIAGSIQYIYTDDEKYKNSKINKGRLIGAIGAWSYFMAWVTVIPIFTIIAAEYLISNFSVFDGMSYWTKIGFYALVGILMYAFIIFTGRNGLESGAKVQLIFAIFTIVPIVVISLAPLLTGDFHMNIITGEFTPDGWKWDGDGILMVLGCLTIAQWSAVGWETAAAYGPSYKEPAKDVPKALMSCGIACLVLYFLIAFCIYGALGIVGIEANGSNSLIAVAENSFGQLAGTVSCILLIVGMVMIVQTAFLGASQTIKSMADDGNFPAALRKTNSKGVPIAAMYAEVFISIVLIVSGVTASQILAVCGFSYALCHMMCQLAFLKSRKDPRFAGVERVYKVPQFLYYASYAVIVFEILLMIGIVYYIYEVYGLLYATFGPLFILLFVPVWYYIQMNNHAKHPEIPCGVNFPDSDGTDKNNSASR